jgi:ABC-type branched-subunit amino acid transport system substrate-binding protein
MRFILLFFVLCGVSYGVSFAAAGDSLLVAEKYAGAVKGNPEDWKGAERERKVVLFVEASLAEKDLKNAKSAAENFLSVWPESKYRARIETALAVIAVREREAFRAAEILRRVASYTRNPVAQKRAAGLFSQIVGARLLTSDELQDLLDRGLPRKELRSLVQNALGDAAQGQGRLKAARYWYARAGQGKTVAAEGAGKPVILCVGPFSGANADLGAFMAQGVLLAQEQLEKQTGKRFLLRILDDRDDPAYALSQVRTALAQDSVVGIIGPLLSGPATAVAAWLSSAAPRIPMLTPTADAEGIAKIGANIFQLNVSAAELAKSIAQYAVGCLGLHEFGLLVPQNSYSSLMAAEFERQVEGLGGEVIAKQVFTEGKPTYKTEYERLCDPSFRQVGRGLVQQRSDYERMTKAEKKKLTKSERDRAEREFQCRIQFPALFIPSTGPADAAFMASQASYYNLKKTKLLGSSGWQGRELLVNGKAALDSNQGYFSVAFAGADTVAAWKRFKSAFEGKWGAAPDAYKVAGLSYDAFRILAAAFDPAQIQNRSFESVYGTIHFDQNGSNTQTAIYTVEEGKLKDASKCRSQNQDFQD